MILEYFYKTGEVHICNNYGDGPVEEWDGDEFILVSKHALSKGEIKKLEDYKNNPSRGTPKKTKANKMFFK